MSTDSTAVIQETLSKDEKPILSSWLAALERNGAFASGRSSQSEVQNQGKDLLRHLKDALAGGNTDARSASYDKVRELLSDISRARAIQGFTASETAVFVFSLKEQLFERLRERSAGDPARLAESTWAMSRIIDDLGVFTMEIYQKTREEVIVRQQQEIAELSTPVVQLWDGILALPLIGTLDSARTQVVMENLLQSIVDESATIAIIDITGVPTVDTLVAQHLLKTIAAARLMGAECLISGIRPQIAQTMVHLGVELDVVSKATLADAFAVALRQTGRMVTAAKA